MSQNEAYENRNLADQKTKAVWQFDSRAVSKLVRTSGESFSLRTTAEGYCHLSIWNARVTIRFSFENSACAEKHIVVHTTFLQNGVQSD